MMENRIILTEYGIPANKRSETNAVTKTASETTKHETTPLAGQVALITGAGRGIGRAIAIRLAELGAHTFLCGRSRPALEQTAAAIDNRQSSEKDSSKSTIVECDVTDLASIEALARQVDSTFQRLDILVNNAGIAGAGGPLLHHWPPPIGIASSTRICAASFTAYEAWLR
jgi:NAD(P)-dependent dehydrogenase (short-subunit alcohol dehydrogenase family)